MKLHLFYPTATTGNNVDIVRITDTKIERGRIAREMKRRFTIASSEKRMCI